MKNEFGTVLIMCSGCDPGGDRRTRRQYSCMSKPAAGSGSSSNSVKRTTSKPHSLTGRPRQNHTVAPTSHAPRACVADAVHRTDNPLPTAQPDTGSRSAVRPDLFSIIYSTSDVSDGAQEALTPAAAHRRRGAPSWHSALGLHLRTTSPPASPPRPAHASTSIPSSSR